MGMNCFMLEYISGVSYNDTNQLTNKQIAMIYKRSDYESDDTEEFKSNDMSLYDIDSMNNVADVDP